MRSVNVLARSMSQQDEHVRSLLDHLDEAMLVMNTRGAIEYVNPLAARMFSVTQDEVKGRSPFKEMTDESRVAAENAFAELVEGKGTHRQMRVRVRRGGKREIIILAKARVLPYEGASFRILVTLQNVTHDVEKRLRQDDEERRFRTLVSAMDDIIFLLDREGRYTGTFGRWMERSGVTPDMFVGRTAREVLGPEAAGVHEAAVHLHINIG